MLVLATAIVWNIAAWIAWDSSFIMNDGIQYLSTASNWLQGQGFSTNALIFNPHFQGQLPAAQTVWPPGFSALLLPLGLLGIELQTAALAINFLATALSGLLVYLILRRCGSGQLLSVASASLFYFTTKSWHLAVSLLSEPLFTCLILTAIYCLPCNHRRHAGRWVLSGFFVAACIAVRYSGVFTAAAFGLGIALVLLMNSYYQHQTLLQKFWKLCLLLALPVLTFAGLMFRTHHLVGTIDRNTGVGEIKTFATTIWKFAEESSILTGFRDGWVFSGDIDTIAFYIFVVLMVLFTVVGFFLLIFKPSHRDNSGTEPVESSGSDCYTFTVVSVVLVHAAAFGGYLAWCSVSSSPLNVTPRYLYQIYPGVFIGFCLLVSYAFSKARHLEMAKTVSLMKVSVGSMVLLYIVAQINVIPVIKEFALPAADVQKSLSMQVAGSDATVLDIVRSCVGEAATTNDSPATSLWSNEGSQYYLNTGVHTITLTQIYTTSDFDFERLRTDIDEYNIRLFVFANNAESQVGGYKVMLSSIKDWLVENQYARLELVEPSLSSGTSFDIYAANEDCFVAAN